MSLLLPQQGAGRRAKSEARRTPSSEGLDEDVVRTDQGADTGRLLQPGFTNAGTGAWETLNPECPGENFARPIRDTPEDELWDAFPEFRNKSIVSRQRLSNPNDKPQRRDTGPLKRHGPWRSHPVHCVGHAMVPHESTLTEQLFAGDSVGRHLFEWFCFLGKTDVALSFPPGFENIQYGPSSYCTITGLGMKVAQIHTYSESRVQYHVGAPRSD